MIDVGLHVPPHLGMGPQARDLEDAGFSRLWVYDSPLVFGDPWMALVEAARATSTIELATGVTHPRARSALATAQALGTLATAAPGRVALGIGTGFSARRALGASPATLAELRTYVEDVRELLSGWGTYREGGHQHPVRFVNTEPPWMDMRNPVGLWVSAFGPKGQEMAGAVADGVIVRWEGSTALQLVRDRIEVGAARAGRSPHGVRIAVLCAMFPTEAGDSEEEEQLRAAIGPMVRTRLSYLIAHHRSSGEVAPAFRPGFDAYLAHRARLDEREREVETYDGYLTRVPEYLAESITPEAIRQVAFVAPTADVIAEIRDIERAGADHVALQLVGPPAAWLRRMATEVLPAIGGGSDAFGQVAKASR